MAASRTVARYLEALGAGDFAALADTLADGVVRIGPYGDVVEGATRYAAYLEKVVANLDDYRLEVQRILPTGASEGDGPSEGLHRPVAVRLTETVRGGDGMPLRTEEMLLFELDDMGRIARIEVYLRSSTSTSTSTSSGGVL